MCSTMDWIFAGWTFSPMNDFMALLEGAAMVDAEASYSILDELGLKEVSIAIKSLR